MHERICSLAVPLAVLPLASVGADNVVPDAFKCTYTVALAVFPRTGIGKFLSIVSVCAGALAVG